MIADLIRAFVEAVIVRELQPQLPPGARVEALFQMGRGGGLHVRWSEP